jgi:hypothetical protein
MTDDNTLTSEIDSECGKDAIYAVDVLAYWHDFRIDPVKVGSKIGEFGIGKSEADRLERWVNKRRDRAGKTPIKAGTITPSVSIKTVIDYVC